MPENIRTASLNTLMLFGVGTHSKGDPDITHLTFTQKSKCGGNRWASRNKFPPSKGLSLFQEGVSPGLLEKKERGEKKEWKKRKEKIMKKIKREKKKERKEEGKSGREPATFTQNSIWSWLHTHKQLTHAYNQENASLPFQAFAAPLNTPSPQQFPDIHRICWR